MGAHSFPPVRLATVVAATASGNGSTFPAPAFDRGITFVVDVSAASGTLPTLDVKIQTSFDGVTWFDVMAFFQITTGATKVIKSMTTAPPAQAELGTVFSTSTLAADFGKSHFGPYWRARWLIGGTVPEYTFTVDAGGF